MFYTAKHGKFLTFKHCQHPESHYWHCLNQPFRYHLDTMGVVPIKISGPLITTHTAHFVTDDSTPKGQRPQH